MAINKQKVQPVQRVHPNSRPNRMAELEKGESVSEARRISIDHATKDSMEEAYTSLKSVMSKAANFASKRSGHQFVTEMGDFRTRSGDLIVVAVVTRIA